jgi:hypothetical protein
MTVGQLLVAAFGLSRSEEPELPVERFAYPLRPRFNGAHARPHPQARQRSARDLAYPLCRRPCRHDRRALWGRKHGRAMGVTLRVLPGRAAGRAAIWSRRQL